MNNKSKQSNSSCALFSWGWTIIRPTFPTDHFFPEAALSRVNPVQAQHMAYSLISNYSNMQAPLFNLTWVATDRCLCSLFGTQQLGQNGPTTVFNISPYYVIFLQLMLYSSIPPGPVRIFRFITKMPVFISCFRVQNMQ